MNKTSLVNRMTFKLVLLLLLSMLMACGGGGGGGGQTSFTVAGTITPSSGSQTDSDVNDPNYRFVSNNQVSSAQVLPNPVSLGGFVSIDGTGVSGDRFANSADNRDYFSVQLAPGQIINLQVASGNMDIDLYLYDQNLGPIGSSVSPTFGGNESITVPNNIVGVQDYIVEVRALSSNNINIVATNYVLIIGLSGQSLANHGYQLDQDFVPGELIVRFDDQALPNGILSDSLDMRASSIGMQAMAGAPGRAMLMKMGDKKQITQAQKMPGMLEPGLATSKLQKKLDTLLTLKTLSRRSDIKQVRLNHIYKPLVTPDDVNYPAQWHYPLINLPQAWDVTQGSASVIVAVVDTGVLLGHPDMNGKLVPGYDFIRDPDVAADGGGIDNNPDDPGDQGFGFSSTFHGTHVAGTVGASTNNNAGVAGVGWNTRVMPLRALGVGGGTSYDIEQGVLFAAGLANDSNTLPAQRADIINLSLGGTGALRDGNNNVIVPQAYVDARNAGVILIAAAGNDSTSVPLYPASYTDVVSVSAVDLNKQLAYYSNFGSNIDVAAPGGDTSQNLNGDIYPDGVMSTQGSDSSQPINFTYGVKNGTSMAAPHIAGVAALMKAVHPGLTPAEFDTALQSGAITEDLGDPNWDPQYGHGLIDALSAVLVAQQLAGGGALPANPFLAVSPGSINFGSTGTTATLNVRNAGTGALNVSSLSEDSGGWLTITAGTVDGSNLGDYTLTVNRTGLADNTYTAEITVTSSVNTVTIPVIMQKVSIASFDDAGVQYILLYDPALPPTSAVIAQAAVTATNGTYSFNFTNVAAGDYQIYSGSDLDNDGFICSVGESCGFYPNSSPDQLTFAVSTDVLNADFVTGFNSGTLGATLSSDKGVNKGIPLSGMKKIAR